MADKKSRINEEIDKPFEEIDLDLIEEQVNELFAEEGYTGQISKREIRKSANKIIHNRKNRKTDCGYLRSSKRLTACVVIAIIKTLTVAVSANTSFIADGINWLNNKFNIYTEAPSDSDPESSANIKNLFNNHDYKLPRNIPATFSAIDFYTTQRSAECTDICFQMIGNRQSLNFIISNYSTADAVSATVPSINADIRTQLQVGNITVSVFAIDEIYTAYYVCGNKAYQISSDMTYEDFINILNSIN